MTRTTRTHTRPTRLHVPLRSPHAPHPASHTLPHKPPTTRSHPRLELPARVPGTTEHRTPRRLHHRRGHERPLATITHTHRCTRGIREPAANTSIVNIILLISVPPNQLLTRREKDVPAVRAGVHEPRVARICPT